MREDNIVSSAVLNEEENWIVATDVATGIASQGKSCQEALDNLKEALELYSNEESEVFVVEKEI